MSDSGNGIVNQGYKSIDLDNNNLESKPDPARRAILVQNGVKSYGSKTILSGINMEVKEGQIYALLGSSGCGKTTLLSCILGLRKFTKGSVEIFGYQPGTKESGVPGSRVGYMPQNISLFEEMTIREVTFYFGRIYGMDMGKVEERMRFILKLLKLDDENKLIRNLSGGQQRRASFSVSLIHDAKILILDEPTVGVDPLLRQCIWDYLNNLVATEKTTIVITTHYIEEANNASMIAFLRNGRVLVEDTPTKLKEQYNCGLEEIVLKLCLRDESPEVQALVEQEKEIKMIQPSMEARIPWTGDRSTTFSRLRALVVRNFLQMWRNIGFIALLLFFPAAGVFLVGLAIGGDLKDLNFGLVNLETGLLNCEGLEKDLCSDASSEHLSCFIPDYFPEDLVKWKHYLTEKEASQAADDGDIWGFITVPKNFSDIFPETSVNNLWARIDPSNQLIAQELRAGVSSSFEKFTMEFKKCTGDIGNITSPIHFEQLFTDEEISFTVFIAPGVHMLLILFMGLSLTGLTLILEKKAGMFERSICSGVSQNEIVLSHFISQYGIMLIQATFSFLVLVFAFDLPTNGPIIGIIIITVFNGTIGTLLGLAISGICEEEASVMQLSLAFIMPLFLLSGLIWPLAGIPKVLRYIAYVFPMALPSESFRAIMSKGWNLAHETVYLGFISSAGWIVFLVLVIYLLNRFNRMK